MSPLNELDYFHVANGQLPQDIMHVIYEGVLPLEIRLLLSKIVNEEHLFTLDSLNERFSSFPYGRNEVKNKLPRRIEQRHLKGTNKLPLSGIIMCSIVKI